MNEFDLVILGGGSGGYASALRGAQLGLSVVLIEKDKVGGTCLHRGCIPTKALLHAGEIADSTRHAADFGVKAEFLSMDMLAVNAYKDGVISKLYKGLQGLVKSRNITVVEGHGPNWRWTTSPIAPGTPASRPFTLISTAPALPIVKFTSWLSLKDFELPLGRVPLKSKVPELSDTASQVEPEFAEITTATGVVLVATAVVPAGAPLVTDDATLDVVFAL